MWIRDCNLMATVRAGANEIWVVWCIGNTPEFKDGLLEQYVHMVEMSALGALHAEFAEIAALNDRIAKGERPYGHDRPIVVHFVEPEYPLPLDPDFMAGRIDASTLVDCGHRDASRYLAGMTPGGIVLTPGSTRMKTPGHGIAFREAMTGRITFGVTDPQIGYDDPAAVPFVLKASIAFATSTPSSPTRRIAAISPDISTRRVPASSYPRPVGFFGCFRRAATQP